MPDFRQPATRRRSAPRSARRRGAGRSSFLDLTLPHHLAPACASRIQSLSLMEKTGSHPGVAHAHAHADGHDIHEDLGFWRKYVFSLDHKVIGIQYAVTGLTF